MTSENTTEIYDTDIQNQELEKGVYLANILKFKLNKKIKEKKTHHGLQHTQTQSRSEERRVSV